MREIEQIYHNNFGIAFYWKQNSQTILDKVQLVFKETGFYLSKEELNIFADNINPKCFLSLKYFQVESVTNFFKLFKV